MGALLSPAAARFIAFYLPQFHPIPENDAWWGRGFTEWTNAAKAKPLFEGHYQPHIPADLGFYDLRVPETRAAQAAMAREHGIEAFCYYHYWFAGRRILERVFQEVLISGEPAFPFCLCWANQSWTGVWHGAPDRMLIEQTYPGERDHAAHFETLLPAFRDPRYLTVDGKPLFMIFAPRELPQPASTLDLWRNMACAAGLPGLHIVGTVYDASSDPRTLGLDGGVATLLPPLHRDGTRPTVLRYGDVAPRLVLPPAPGIERYPCAIPNWDNTPRSGMNGRVLHDSTPEAFAEHLLAAVRSVKHYPPQRKLVFIKSWNEWAEGNHLEPDLKFGRRYLEVVRDALALVARDAR
jgi:lipopolysaccharide biosynthesis protein